MGKQVHSESKRNQGSSSPTEELAADYGQESFAHPRVVGMTLCDSTHVGRRCVDKERQQRVVAKGLVPLLRYDKPGNGMSRALRNMQVGIWCVSSPDIRADQKPVPLGVPKIGSLTIQKMIFET